MLSGETIETGAHDGRARAGVDPEAVERAVAQALRDDAKVKAGA